MATSSAIKSMWRKSGKHLTLKHFAQGLLEGGEGERKTLAMNWFAHKEGVLTSDAKKERIKNKGAQLAEIRIKVRAARRKNASPEAAKNKKG